VPVSPRARTGANGPPPHQKKKKKNQKQKKKPQKKKQQMVLILKIKLGDDTRRITLEIIPTYSDLVRLCEKLFSKNNFVVKYVDDDEDMVTMSSEIELQEALNVIKQQQTNVLRLFLSEETKKNTTEVPKPVNGSPVTPSFPDFANSPFAQFLNPQMISSFLSNPELMAQASQFMQRLNPQTVNPIADLTTMLQNLGLQQTPSQTAGPQQGQPTPASSAPTPGLEQVLGNLSQFLGNFANGFPQFGVESTTTQTPKSSCPSGKSEDESMVHGGVVCDGCGKRGFSGIRFKCTVCPDFDLCEMCEAKRIHDPNHAFTRITKPVNYGRGFPYFRPGCSSRPVKPPMCGGFNSRDSRFLARFVEDVTVPDGTVSPANLNFVKIWRLRNEGNIAWPEGTRLTFVGGDKLSSSESVVVPSILPGQEVDVAVDMKSPVNPGRYVSYWRLCQPDGNRFGQRVWVDLLVVSPVEKQPEVTIPQTTTPNPIPVETQPSQSAPVQAQQPMEVEQTKPSVPETPATPTRPQPSVHVQQLLDMGFNDRDHIEELLAKNNNDILRTVQDLLNGK